MTVNSLAVWHLYLGLHARWVLGVRHDKERGARKRKRRYCNQEGCSKQVVQGGVCKKHGARVKPCSREGCGKQVVQGGVCVEHGAIRYGNPISNFSVSNFRSRCPTLDDDFQRCPPCTREEATDQALQLNLYAKGIRRISGF